MTKNKDLQRITQSMIVYFGLKGEEADLLEESFKNAFLLGKIEGIKAVERIEDDTNKN